MAKICFPKNFLSLCPQAAIQPLTIWTLVLGWTLIRQSSLTHGLGPAFGRANIRYFCSMSLVFFQSLERQIFGVLRSLITKMASVFGSEAFFQDILRKFQFFKKVNFRKVHNKSIFAYKFCANSSKGKFYQSWS